MITLRKFIRKHEIKFAYKAGSNPAMDANMDHYRCRLRVGTQKMVVPFSKGYGHNGAPPTLREVLACLASDVAAAREGFSNFCDELGYDSDSRKALKTYNACAKISEKLAAVIGEHAVTELVYDVDHNGE